MAGRHPRAVSSRSTAARIGPSSASFSSRSSRRTSGAVDVVYGGVSSQTYVRGPLNVADLSTFTSIFTSAAWSAATLNAYFIAEHATIFRRLLWRRLAMIALGAWLLEAFTPLMPGVGLAMTVGLAGTAGCAAFINEQRAHGRLRALLSGHTP